MSNNVKNLTSKKSDGAISMGANTTRSKVFIQRDFSDGTGIKFQTRFPSELDGRIEKKVFENTIKQLNEYFAEAERSNCSTYCNGCFACLTVYCFQLCTETKYEKCLRKASKFIMEQNERIYQPKGLCITDPCARGLRVLEIVFQD